MKAITRRDLPDEPIIGLHYVGPNAGEVMQGFGVAMKAGLTKSESQNYESDFQLRVPSSADFDSKVYD